MSRWSQLTLYIADDLSSIDTYRLSDNIFKVLEVETAQFACTRNSSHYSNITLGSSIDGLLEEKLDQIVKTLSQYLKIGYGIFYIIRNQYDTGSYDMGLDYITLYPCEVSEPFYRATTTFTHNEHPAYFTSKLRMIYPYNVLNKHHMDMPINGQSLKQYITNDPLNGVLKQINDYQYSWKLNRKGVHRLNRIFGQAGLLIGYNTSPNSTQNYNMQGCFRK